MNDSYIVTLEQIKKFLDGTEEITFTANTKEERYQWIEVTLRRFKYHSLKKPDKGLLVRYMQKLSGYSRQHLTRLIQKHRKTGRVRRKQYLRNTFPRNYTREDILLLAKTDELHNDLSGPATKKLMERAFEAFKQKEYESLSSISISHIYNLRKSYIYTQKRKHFSKTKRTPIQIAERRKPQPNGQPGYIRIDTVHQGDLDGRKGVYHINAVDEVTQFEIVCTVEKISERYLIPALEFLLDSFPFEIKGFHSDNGSEYINREVAKLLGKLLIEFTKSRARHSNDNALAECKNGSVVRKLLGYVHIPQKYAPLVNEFNKDYLNPYLNYHRPCYFPVIKVDKKGKERKTYPYKGMMTPYDKLKSLPNAEQYLKPDTSFDQLDEFAMQMTDNDAADTMNKARGKLFDKIFKSKSVA